MSNVGNLEQQIASLQIGDEAAKGVAKPGKKVGPAVPPKPKKSQPQVNPKLLAVKICLFIYRYLSRTLTQTISPSPSLFARIPPTNTDATTVTRYVFYV